MTEKELKQALKELKEYCDSRTNCEGCAFRTDIRIGNFVLGYCEYDDVIVVTELGED